MCTTPKEGDNASRSLRSKQRESGARVRRPVHLVEHHLVIKLCWNLQYPVTLAVAFTCSVTTSGGQGASGLEPGLRCCTAVQWPHACRDRCALMSRYPPLLWLATSSAWLGSVQFGFHLGILNTCLVYTSRDLHVAEDRGGAVAVSALLVGAAIGAFCAGQIADTLGPRRASQWNTVPLMLGSLLSAIAPANHIGFGTMLLGQLPSEPSAMPECP